MNYKKSKNNIDSKTVDGFGDEWTRFDQAGMSDEDTKRLFEGYFSVFPWSDLPKNAEGFDLGCGSGRWAKLLAPRVGKLHCIDPSIAIEVARRNLQGMSNCEFHHAGVDEIPLPDLSMDFGYSLGVLHHIPDTQNALASCVAKLKPGAPFLIYIYYAFDNRSLIFKLIWRFSDVLRRYICKFPAKIKHIVCDILAIFIYYPLARVSLFAERIGLNVASIPLSYYRNHSFYTMRTDSRDRFGTPLEQRFTRNQISAMMEEAGLKDVCFSDSAPYWSACGIKR